MAELLLVVRPFESRALGDLILDASEISNLLAGEHAHHVVRVVAPDPGSDESEEV